jgi:predicted secreted acid phosphatase
MAEDGKDKQKKMKSPKSKAMSKHPVKTASPQIAQVIGDRLRKFYDEVAKQAVPDRFLDLLDRLESKTPPKKSD